MRNVAGVRCFRVLMQGEFDRLVYLGPADAGVRGFYTTRWVIARTKESAVQKAIQSAKMELQQWADIRDRLVGINVAIEDIGSGSWWCWLRGGGRGFSFYFED